MMKTTGMRIAALMLAAMLLMPCAALALGDYIDDAMDEYCDSWTEYYEHNEPDLDLDATLSILVWSHGEYDMYSKGERRSIAETLRSDKSPATFFVESEASFDDEEYTFMLADQYLTEKPRSMTLTANGRTLKSDYDTYDAGGYLFHYFEFDADDVMEVIDHLLSGGSATLDITSDQGSSSVEVSKAKTPKLVTMMKHTRDGRWYSHKDSSRYRDASLLPAGIRVTPKPTPKPTPKTNIPSALQGVTLRLGDDNNKVLTVKRRMQELGYYRPTATVDGRFNDMMVDRLKQFQRNNWISETGVVDARTLEELYSASPVRGEFYVAPTPTPKPEGKYMLVLPRGGNGQWKEASGDKLQMRVQVKNESRRRTVEAFKLHIYSTDIWGERDPEEGVVYTSTTIKDVKPGKTAYSDYFVLPGRSMIDRVYVGVKQMRYSDGTVEEIPDYEVDYVYWTF